jgi:hypothetical protein
MSLGSLRATEPYPTLQVIVAVSVTTVVVLGAGLQLICEGTNVSLSLR